MQWLSGCLRSSEQPVIREREVGCNPLLFLAAVNEILQLVDRTIAAAAARSPTAHEGSMILRPYADPQVKWR